MSSYETAAKIIDRMLSGDRANILAPLQKRAQLVRLGNRYAVSALGSGFVYIVARGVVCIETTAQTDIHAVTSLLYEGDVLIPELQAPLPELTLTTQRPSEFWKLTMTALAEEAEQHPQLRKALFLLPQVQNARAQLHIAAMSGLNSEERIAAVLVEIGAHIGMQAGGAISFDLPLTRYNIADYLALNPDTVSRILSSLVSDGIIERRGRFQFSIRNWRALVAKCPLSEAIIRLHGAGKPLLMG